MIAISDQSTEVLPGFGAWLKEQIQAHGLSQSKLSKRSHVPLAVIRDIVNRESINIRFYNLRALARALDISFPEIYAAAGCSDPDQPTIQEQIKASKSLYRTLTNLIGPDNE